MIDSFRSSSRRTGVPVFCGGALLLSQLVVAAFAATTASAQLVINEIDYDQSGAPDTSEFVELANPSATTYLGGWLHLCGFDGTTGQLYFDYALGTMSVPPGGFFTICVANSPIGPCDFNISPTAPFLNNTVPSAVALADDQCPFAFPSAMDTVTYGGYINFIWTEDMAGGIDGAPVDDPALDGPAGNHSIGRDDSSNDSDDNADDFTVQCASFGAANTPNSSCSAPPATCDYTVKNTNNAGADSLRAAIMFANADPDLTRICFDISGISKVIGLTASLPDVIYPVQIEGETQPGSGPLDPVVINASNISNPGFHLLLLKPGAVASHISTLGFVGYTFSGIGVEAKDVELIDLSVGHSPASGTTDGGQLYGISIFAGAGNTLVDNCVVADNDAAELSSRGRSTVIIRSMIGVVPGVPVIPANGGGAGILFDDCSSCRVGSDFAGEGNVISAVTYGVRINSGTDNEILGNLIGHDGVGGLLGNGGRYRNLCQRVCFDLHRRSTRKRLCR